MKKLPGLEEHPLRNAVVHYSKKKQLMKIIPMV